jgi:hypothetical protein
MTESWSNITINLIKKYLEREHKIVGEVEFTVQIDKCIDIKIPEKEVAFTILHGKPWHDTKKYIDIIFEQLPHVKEPKECTICCNMTIHFVWCAQCHNNQCLQCTVDMFRVNSGLVICPYCNHTVGRHLGPNLVDIVASKMLSMGSSNPGEPFHATFN